jgi:membrane protein DedA with SNARE-associated domain
VTTLIEQLGALGVFLLMVPESACVPVPSEVTLLFAGFAVHQGWMSFTLAVLAATAGNLVGSLLAYALGASRALGDAPLVRTALGRWETLLDRYGVRAVFLARLLPLARTFVSLPAGARRVPLGAFIALTTLGCSLWAAALILVGVIAGAAWGEVDSILGRALLGAGALLLVLTLAGAAGVRISARAEPPSPQSPPSPPSRPSVHARVRRRAWVRLRWR